SWYVLYVFVFFFQAEDGIRDWSVTGVQTCALPIFQNGSHFQIWETMTSRWLALGSVIVSHIWKWLPFWTVILLAGRMAIPQELRSEERRVGKEGRCRWWRDR